MNHLIKQSLNLLGMAVLGFYFSSTLATPFQKEDRADLTGLFYRISYSEASKKYIAPGIEDNERQIVTGVSNGNRLSWTKGTDGLPATGIDIFGLHFGSSKYVGVGGTAVANQVSHPLVIVSPDGSHWIMRKLENFKGSLLDITANPSGTQYVAVGGDYLLGGTPALILTSSNKGETWVSRNSGITGPAMLWQIFYNEQKECEIAKTCYMAIGLAGDVLGSTPPKGLLLTSADGINWIERRNGIPANIMAFENISYLNGQFILIGDRDLSGSSDTSILSSPNGIDWTTVPIQPIQGLPPAASLNWRAIAYNPVDKVYVGVGFLFETIKTIPVILKSTDGMKTWVLQNNGLRGGALYNVIFANKLFLAVGARALDDEGKQTKPVILTSVDGASWLRSY
jgi:hypothetical protein